MANELQHNFTQNRLARYLLLDTLQEAHELWQRYHHVDSFNLYIHERMLRVAAAILLLFLISVGCVMGVVTLLPGIHWLLVLPALLLLPVILAGSLLIQVYIFFSWLEGRSMERALGSRHRAARSPFASWLRQKLKVDLGPAPRVPWLLFLLFVIAPLALLASSWLPAAAAFIALGVLTPALYAAADR